MPKGWNDKLSSFRILGSFLRSDCIPSLALIVTGAGTRGVIGEPTPAPAAAPAATPAPAAAPAAAPKGASLDHVPVVGQKIPGAVQNAIYDKAQVRRHSGECLRAELRRIDRQCARHQRWRPPQQDRWPRSLKGVRNRSAQEYTQEKTDRIAAKIVLLLLRVLYVSPPHNPQMLPEHHG